MKKIVLLLTAAALVLASCGNSADTAGIGAGLVPNTGTTTGGTGVTGGGDTTGTPSSPSDPSGGVTIGPDGTVTISSSKMVYVGEGTETIDAVTYNVKKYAQLVIDDNPYFYTYYKLYYLNGKLRRLYMFDHGIGSDMDFKYDEFVEHQCGERDVKNKTSTTSSMMIVSTSSPIKIYTYYEDGKIESYLVDSSAAYAAYMMVGIIPKCAYEYYPNGATKVYKTYACINTHDLNAAASWALYSKKEYEYHSNGKPKQEKTYSNTNTAKPSEGTMYLSGKTTYSETGKTESSISYAADGTETSKTLYTYYGNGNQKSSESYNTGKLSSKITYYESGNPQKAESYRTADGKLYQIYTFYDEKGTNSVYVDGTSLSGKQKLSASYNSYINPMPAGTETTSWYLQNIAYYYNSGYIKHYYMGMNPNHGDGTFYTYADNKTKTSSYDSSVYSSMESMSQEQAEAKLAELLNE